MNIKTAAIKTLLKISPNHNTLYPTYKVSQKLSDIACTDIAWFKRPQDLDLNNPKDVVKNFSNKYIPYKNKGVKTLRQTERPQCINHIIFMLECIEGSADVDGKPVNGNRALRWAGFISAMAATNGGELLNRYTPQNCLEMIIHEETTDQQAHLLLGFAQGVAIRNDWIRIDDAKLINKSA